MTVGNSEPNDFVRRKLVSDLSRVAVQKIVNNASEDRCVYCHRIEPGSYEQGYEFHENGASAYELYVICTQAGEVLEVNQRVQHCPCGSRSFAPHGAPVHIFPPDAMFDLSWDDIAPSARDQFLAILTDMTEQPVRAPKTAPPRGRRGNAVKPKTSRSRRAT